MNVYLTLIFFVVLAINFIYFFNVGMMSLLEKVHDRMAESLLYAPLNEFFDRVPLGRILNRFTKDI